MEFQSGFFLLSIVCNPAPRTFPANVYFGSKITLPFPTVKLFSFAPLGPVYTRLARPETCQLGAPGDSIRCAPLAKTRVPTTSRQLDGCLDERIPGGSSAAKGSSTERWLARANVYAPGCDKAGTDKVAAFGFALGQRPSDRCGMCSRT